MLLGGIPIRRGSSYLANMLVPLLLLASTVAQPPTADAVVELSKGSALYRVCRAEIRLMDLPSITKASQSDLLNGSYCVGYLNGFMANLTTQTNICTNSAPVSALVRAYVGYLDKNPDLLGEDRRLGLGMALHDAFPCPTRQTPGLAQAGVSRVSFHQKP